jgi:hypothetical protein
MLTGPPPKFHGTRDILVVPFSIILHITTIRVLLAKRRRARDAHTSVATSAMTASGR